MFLILQTLQEFCRKNTSQLIPLCHPIQLSKIIFEPNKIKNTIKITAETSCNGKTGVEMKSFTAVCTAALTIYDMRKSLDKRIKINDVHLIHKSGGKPEFFMIKNNLISVNKAISNITSKILEIEKPEKIKLKKFPWKNFIKASDIAKITLSSGFSNGWVYSQ